MRPTKKQKTSTGQERDEYAQSDAGILWCPRALIGQSIKVLWPSENRYFSGKVVKYLPKTFQHEILYEDGDEETLVLATEKVQLLAASLPRLPPPPPGHLPALARHLARLAEELQAKGAAQRTARGRCMIKDEDRAKIEALLRRASDARAAEERRAKLARQAEERRRLEAMAAAAPMQPQLDTAAAKGLQQRRGGVGEEGMALMGDEAPAGHVQPVRSGGQAFEGVRGDGEGQQPAERVCSPASAKRRKQQQKQQQQQQRRFTRGTAAGETENPGTPGKPKIEQSCLEALEFSSAAPCFGDQVAGAGLTAGWAAWGVERGGKGHGGVDGNLGRLYVPRPYPVVRLRAAAAGTAAGGSAAAAVSAAPECGGEANRPTSDASMDVDAPPVEAAAEAAGAAQGEEGGQGQPAAQAQAQDDEQDAGDDERRARAALTEELRTAYMHFRTQCGSFKQYHELQVLLWLAPEQLVGRELRVLWPDEEAWFCGRVTSFEPHTGRHTVEYDDGDVEHLHLGAEEVRLQLVPGEAERLAPQGPAGLLQAAAAMAADAAALQQRLAERQQQEQQQQQGGGKAKQNGKGDGPSKGSKQQQREGTGEEGGGQGEQEEAAGKEEEDADELAAKAERWSTRAAQLRALAVLLQQREAAAPAAAGAAPPPAAAPSTTAAGAANDARQMQSEQHTLQPPEASGKATGDAQHGAEQAERETGSDASAADAGAAAESVAGPPSDWQEVQVLRPGEVVFGQVRRAAPWPAIVITREEAEREGLAAGSRTGGAQASVFVRFFGDHTVCCLPAVAAGQRLPDRGGVLAFLAALEAGWHVRRTRGEASSGAQARRFAQAMCELRTYLQDGELPRGMIPPNYDDDEEEEDEDEQEGQLGRGKASGGRRGGKGATAHAASAHVSLPLVVSNKLTVTALGEVVWLSRWFHDEKYIYPVGYRAVRLMASGASGGREVRHTMEVLADADGVKPVFRITPAGCPAVEADSATRAMKALFEGDDRTSGRAFAKTGADLFGLSSPRVVALLRCLPGAERCERFANWPPDADRPPVPQLTAAEEVRRRALYARALRLPSGVEPQPQRKEGMCFECEVCGEDEESLSNLKLECDLCRCVVHAVCYGVQQQQHPGGMWLCDVCQLVSAGLPAERRPPCELCPVSGGPMKATEEGRYVHVLCAVWTPGVTFGDEVRLEPVEGVAKAVQSRSSLLCFLCKQPHGAPVQCAGDSRCYTAFHPMCAREAGLAMCEMRAEGKGRKGAGASKGAAAGGGRRGPGRRAYGSVGMGAAKKAAAAAPGAAGLAVLAGQDECGQENVQPVSGTAGHGHPQQLQQQQQAGTASTSAVGVLAAAAEEGLLKAASGDAGNDCGLQPIASADPPDGLRRTSSLAAASSGTSSLAPAVDRPPVLQPVPQPPAPRTETDLAPSALPPAQRGGRPPASASAPSTFAASRRSRPPPVSVVGRMGVSLGDGTSLLCFCPRHEDRVLEHADMFRASYPGKFAERRAAAARCTLREQRQRQLAEEQQQNQQQLQQQQEEEKGVEKGQRLGGGASGSGMEKGRGGAGAEGGGGGGCGAVASSRAVSFQDWRSRGHRAPEAIAIAKEKRTFVRQLPYLVSGRVQVGGAAVREACPSGWRAPTAAQAAPSVLDGDVCDMEKEEDPQQQEQEAKAMDVDCGGGAAKAMATPSGGGGGGKDVGGSGLPAELVAGAVAAGAESVGERYAAMRASVRQRLAAGKSAIHGWGAFAKVAHKRGDMVIEYAGELIRPVVSDLREKTTYDQLVGCGTYIFNLSEQQHIDATRAGNMAHLLNHSCDPNCYSRTITLWDPTTRSTRDHVIIMAKRDLQPWEELTYDYRFSSSVELPCNCGADTCRVFVNWPGSGREEEEDEEDEEDGEGEGPEEHVGMGEDGGKEGVRG